jgi:hypothetical protein
MISFHLSIGLLSFISQYIIQTSDKFYPLPPGFQDHKIACLPFVAQRRRVAKKPEPSLAKITILKALDKYLYIPARRDAYTYILSGHCGISAISV